ncbi:transglutaminase-like domain-containing protein [Kribbella sp. NBC_01245]|uniref:transglutaminase-like domain-containing protein n=1 Tax=Kribbella sp. NBC_01245 TaxID=2903578 RepID=UPI002E2D9A8D|nr:transglutaminase-like domain-containing protein [Kribbella sp. NBC_01245]
MTLDYRTPGPFTTFDPGQIPLTQGLPDDPVGICQAVQSLVIQPYDATPAGVPDDRIDERNLRPVNAIVDALTAIDPTPLTIPRPKEKRVVGCCRHFVTLATALMRERGIPARARAGFGTYFNPEKNFDHWIVEYDDGERWVRIDAEHLGHGYVAEPADLAPGEFLTGGEAWALYREGKADGMTFGVVGTDHAWGPGEIRGNVIRDLAALNKWEPLNWDEWGRITDSYEGKTGADYDDLIDRIAAACARDEPSELEEVYAAEELTLPDSFR